MASQSLEQVSAVIRTSSDLFEQNFRAADAAKLVADYYVKEPIMSAPDAPVLRGREAIAGLFEAIFKDFSDCRLVQHFVRVGNDLAYEVSSAFLIPNSGGEEVECRYMIAWRRDAETWRVEADFFAYGKLL